MSQRRPLAGLKLEQKSPASDAGLFFLARRLKGKGDKGTDYNIAVSFVSFLFFPLRHNFKSKEHKEKRDKREPLQFMNFSLSSPSSI